MAQESCNDETGFQAPQGPVLCANNCGFFGSQTTMNLCSKCYRDINQAQAAFELAQNRAETVAKSPIVTDLKNSAESSCGQQESLVAKEQQPKQPPNRCLTCKKRVGLTGFKCRCDGIFCSIHRYSDKHECSYDYKAAQREIVAKANPVVKASKVDKI